MTNHRLPLRAFASHSLCEAKDTVIINAEIAIFIRNVPSLEKNIPESIASNMRTSPITIIAVEIFVDNCVNSFLKYFS